MPRSPLSCRHCGLDVPPGRPDEFCCAGCAFVYRRLHAEGLGRFYD
ncbi:MAG: heavy metal translocating P-type ATPase metal-binding domain-containing protein, partial [Myxococcota bacterium]